MKRTATEENEDVPEAKQRVLAIGSFDGKAFSTLLRKRSTTLSELLAYFITALEKFDAGLTPVDPVVEFLKNSLGGEELVQYLKDEISELELRFLFDVLERIFSRLDSTTGDASNELYFRIGLHLLEEVLNHVDVIYEQLGSFHNATVRQTITMLVAATGVGPSAVTCLLQKFDLSHHKVMRLFTKKMCVNELMSLFTVMLLRADEEGVAKMMDHVPILQSLLLNLNEVPSCLAVSGFLAALKDRVLTSSLIPIGTKVILFNRHVLRSLCSLLKHERKSLLSYMPSVKSFLSSYLECVHVDDHSCGLSGRNKNPTITHLFRLVLDAFHFEQLREVGVDILRLCPDQLQHCGEVCSSVVKSGRALRLVSLLHEYFSSTLPSFGVFLHTHAPADPVSLTDIAVPIWIYKTLLVSSLKSFKAENFTVGCDLLAVLLKRQLVVLDVIQGGDAKGDQATLSAACEKFSTNAASFNELIACCNHAKQIFSSGKSPAVMRAAVDIMILTIKMYSRCSPLLLDSVDFGALYYGFEKLMDLDAKLDFLSLMFGPSSRSSSSAFDVNWFVRWDKSRGSGLGRLLRAFISGFSSSSSGNIKEVLEHVLLSLFDKNVFLQSHVTEMYLWLNNFVFCHNPEPWDNSSKCNILITLTDFFAEVVSVAYCNPFQKYDVLLNTAGVIDFQACMVQLLEDHFLERILEGDKQLASPEPVIEPSFSIMTLIALEMCQGQKDHVDEIVQCALRTQLQSLLLLQCSGEAQYVKLLESFSSTFDFVWKLLRDYGSFLEPKPCMTCDEATGKFARDSATGSSLYLKSIADLLCALCWTKDCSGTCGSTVASVLGKTTCLDYGGLNIVLLILYLLKAFSKRNRHAFEVLSCALAKVLEGEGCSSITTSCLLQDEFMRRRFFHNDILLSIVLRLLDSGSKEDVAKGYVLKAVSALAKGRRKEALLKFLVHFRQILKFEELETVVKVATELEWSDEGFTVEVNLHLNTLWSQYLETVDKSVGDVLPCPSLIDGLIRMAFRVRSRELMDMLSRFRTLLRFTDVGNIFSEEFSAALQSALTTGLLEDVAFLCSTMNAFPAFVKSFLDWCLEHYALVKVHRHTLLPIFAQSASQWSEQLSKFVYKLYKKQLKNSTSGLSGDDIIKITGALFRQGLVPSDMVSLLCCGSVKNCTSLLMDSQAMTALAEDICCSSTSYDNSRRIMVRLLITCITERSDVTSFEKKLVDHLAFDPEASVAALERDQVTQLVTATLARRFFSPRHLVCLANMVEACNDRFQHLPLVAMIYGHSEFGRHFVQEADPVTKLAIAKLLLNSASRCPPEHLLASHVPVILSSYGAELTEADVCLLKLLYVYEQNGIDLSSFYPFVWGSRGLDCYASLKLFGHALWNRPSPNEILDILDAKKVQKTIAECPLTLNFDVTAPSSLFVSGIYDPRFLLLVFGTLLKQDSVLNCRRFVEKSCLALLFFTLSFHDQNLRALGYYLLIQFCELRNNEKFLERRQVLYLVSLLRRSVCWANQRLSYIMALFFGRVSLMMLYPADPLYSIVNGYLLYRPSICLDLVPNFNRICYSSSESCHQERHWMLNLLVDGVKELKDYAMLRNENVFQMLMCYYGSKLCRASTKRLILNLLHAACTIQSAAYDLCTNMNILAWIHAVLKAEKDAICLSLLMKILDALASKHLSNRLLRCASVILRRCSEPVLAIENKRDP